MRNLNNRQGLHQVTAESDEGGAKRQREGGEAALIPLVFIVIPNRAGDGDNSVDEGQGLVEVPTMAL